MEKSRKGEVYYFMDDFFFYSKEKKARGEFSFSQMTFVSLIKVGDKEVGHGHPSTHKEIQIEGKNNNLYLFILIWPLVTQFIGPCTLVNSTSIPRISVIFSPFELNNIY
jgi:hypothetical protein